jgi:hypothetical protein
MPVWHAGSPAGCEVREPMSFPAGILWGGRNEYKKRTGTNRWGRVSPVLLSTLSGIGVAQGCARTPSCWDAGKGTRQSCRRSDHVDYLYRNQRVR